MTGDEKVRAPGSDPAEDHPDLDVEALVDGNLEAKEAERVEAAMRRDRNAIGKMMRFAQLNARLRKLRPFRPEKPVKDQE